MTTDYIVPIALSFLERQTVSYINGLKFMDIKKMHLAELSKWIKIPAKLITDNAKAAERANKIATLA